MNAFELNALFRKLAATDANLDLQEGQARTGATTSLRQLGVDREDALRRLSEGYASQGLTHSGINLRNQARTRENYSNQEGQVRDNLTQVLTNIAKKRLEAQSEYDTSTALTRLGM